MHLTKSQLGIDFRLKKSYFFEIDIGQASTVNGIDYRSMIVNFSWIPKHVCFHRTALHDTHGMYVMHVTHEMSEVSYLP